MDLQLCDHLYISHSVDSKTRAKNLPKKIYKVNGKIAKSSNFMPVSLCSVSEMEVSLGGVKREHFTLEVLPRLLQKGERLAK